MVYPRTGGYTIPILFPAIAKASRVILMGSGRAPGTASVGGGRGGVGRLCQSGCAINSTFEDVQDEGIVVVLQCHYTSVTRTGRKPQDELDITMATSTTRANPYDFVYEVRNPDLFAGRREELTQLEEEVARLATAHPIAPMVAIVGERRIGKTSISLRVQEACEKHDVLALRVALTGITAADPWEFWHEIFYGLLHTARNRFRTPPPNLGFRTEAAPMNPQFNLTENHLAFFSAYAARSPSSLVPHNHLVYEGLRSLIDAITGADLNGVLLIIDESHLVVNNHVLTQQLRFAIREAGRCGVVLVGETGLSQLFADRTQPLFAQGSVIPLDNFAAQSDIAECALLPLAEDERRLMSPMTIDYLVKLSQGKPNQIRLICHSIYNRYQKGQQVDLNITIEALDDVLN